MRPTFSIIAFTTLSGIGYGLWFIVGLGLAVGISIDTSRFAFGFALVAGALFASAGLLASVAHLGKPLRAWRAFSQWRSSWLSREAIVALATYVPALAIGALLVSGSDAGITLRLLGALLAALSVSTVTCTARIYSSLPPIRAWANRYTLPSYLLLGAFAGALWFCALHASMVDDARESSFALAVLIANAIAIAPAAAWVKRSYWRHIDALAPIGAGTATGLSKLGTVRSFEQPHTEENYLTREMGFVLACKHARKLRALAFWTILSTPLASIALHMLIGRPGFWMAAIVGSAAVFVERWLFFAEAKHAVAGYYVR